MSKYIVRIGEELTFVLKNARSTQPEQFAGYCANLDFWHQEFLHLKSLVDGYEMRFQRMSEARDNYLKAGNRKPQHLDDYSEPYQRPRKTTRDHERNRVLREAKDAFLQFLRRGIELGTILEEDYERLCDELAEPPTRHESL